MWSYRPQCEENIYIVFSEGTREKCHRKVLFSKLTRWLITECKDMDGAMQERVCARKKYYHNINFFAERV